MILLPAAIAPLAAVAAGEVSMGPVLSGPIVVRQRAFYGSPHAGPSQWVRAFRHDQQL